MTIAAVMFNDMLHKYFCYLSESFLCSMAKACHQAKKRLRKVEKIFIFHVFFFMVPIFYISNICLALTFSFITNVDFK